MAANNKIDNKASSPGAIQQTDAVPGGNGAVYFPTALLNKQALCKFLGIKIDTLKELIDDESMNFPPPFWRKYWSLFMVQEWLRSCPKNSHSSEAENEARAAMRVINNPGQGKDLCQQSQKK